ncbi:hypothetical protein EJ06DRAFT_125718 [Trichodelitschia bisporula]|uniref:CBM1 domain-containing protein n=1 Tax=Trichodelitschia bisporula TaxID=703511 RepID=A0A6G1HQZ5_9PEZI|nr:hypothetical protein EJ06DRAFT_125718 [Trichodelitschia bisporula]
MGRLIRGEGGVARFAQVFARRLSLQASLLRYLLVFLVVEFDIASASAMSAPPPPPQATPAPTPPPAKTSPPSAGPQCFVKTNGKTGPSPWSPCGAVNGTNPYVPCCASGDFCVSNGLCRYTYSQGGGSGYYAAGCTDGAYGPGTCPQLCSALPLPALLT